MLCHCLHGLQDMELTVALRRKVHILREVYHKITCQNNVNIAHFLRHMTK